jgi:hypothetical protein
MGLLQVVFAEPEPPRGTSGSDHAENFDYACPPESCFG